MFRLDADAYSQREWSGLFLDEAQFVKNHQSKAYQCVRRLPAPFKLAITGTPMENNLMELWSLLSITAPGLFPNPTRFREFYARPIEKDRDGELLAQLRRRIKPLVKRRTKEQVAADLPAKQEQVLEVELHRRHRTIYQRHLQRERQKVLGLINDMDRNRFTILRSLTLLRQLSLHAGLVDDKNHDIPSAKVDALVEQLDDVVGGGHRALVFSQFTGFLDVVRSRLDVAGIDYCYLDGKTRNRSAVIERFKGGSVPVFLISLKAGGFGLNLTEADYCFLLDPWWNPATEAQAVDRTHRIGQTRQVMVYRLIAADTIEQKVMALKARKVAAVLQRDGRWQRLWCGLGRRRHQGVVHLDEAATDFTCTLVRGLHGDRRRWPRAGIDAGRPARPVPQRRGPGAAERISGPTGARNHKRNAGLAAATPADS